MEFSDTLEPFTKVWITALWINPRLQAGPACTPVATNLGTWLVQNVAAPTGDVSASLKAA